MEFEPANYGMIGHQIAIVRFSGGEENFNHIIAWLSLSDETITTHQLAYSDGGLDFPETLTIETDTKIIIAYVGDFIAHGFIGEVHAFNPEVFMENYMVSPYPLPDSNFVVENAIVPFIVGLDANKEFANMLLDKGNVVTTVDNAVVTVEDPIATLDEDG